MTRELKQTIRTLERTGRLRLERQALQHGSTTVFRHSVRVAYVSLLLARKLRLKVDWPALTRGALLHDYFLYDWHRPDPSHRLHGLTHPRAALRNARADFDLTPIEEDIIARHMFPLVPIPPACREGWIVCLADKYCALAETLSPRIRQGQRMAHRLATAAASLLAFLPLFPGGSG